MLCTRDVYIVYTSSKIREIIYGNYYKIGGCLISKLGSYLLRYSLVVCFADISSEQIHSYCLHKMSYRIKIVKNITRKII